MDVCQDCKWWVRDMQYGIFTGKEKPQDYGICERFPAIVQKGEDARTCGEFQPSGKINP